MRNRSGADLGSVPYQENSLVPLFSLTEGWLSDVYLIAERVGSDGPCAGAFSPAAASTHDRVMSDDTSFLDAK